MAKDRMTDREWEKLFALIRKAVNQHGLSATEKGELIRQQADANGAVTDLDEFVAEVEG